MSETAIVLEKYFGPKSLRLAWERMIRSTGKDVKDYFGVQVYGEDLEHSLGLLSSSIISGEYQPQRPFKYFEPKASRTQRTKTVLSIEDALVYQAIGNMAGFLAYDLLAEAEAHVFGSRLHPEVALGDELLDEEDAQFYFFQFYVPLHNEFTRSVNKEITDTEVQFKLETDITGFFDAIPHSKMALTLGRLGIEGPVLDILLKCLNVWSGTKDTPTLGVGIPQGAPTSFLLANLLLTQLDQLVIRNAYTYYRYMDDIRIYEESEEKLVEALVMIDAHLKGLALSLNTKKTSIEELTAEGRKEIHPMRDVSSEEVEYLNTETKTIQIESTESSFLDESGPEIEPLSRWRTIEGEELNAYCQGEIVEVEAILLERFLGIGTADFSKRGLEKDEEFRKDIVHLAYRWRLATSILKDEGKLEANEAMIPIWLFCLEHFFWKAHHFCWNLNVFGNRPELEQQLWSLFRKFKNYEWVRYQILYNLAQSQNFKTTELRTLLRNANEEPSSLVRLGYYHILIKHTPQNSQLFSLLKQSVKEEKEVYVRKVISSLLSRLEGKLAIEEIKYWFGL